VSRLPPRQRIAVIGAGIAGLSAAWLLRDAHEVSLFEAAPRAGGHADTQQITFAGAEVAVDTGFIVYNTHNYRHLTALFAHLGIATEASDMSFGVSIGRSFLKAIEPPHPKRVVLDSIIPLPTKPHAILTCDQKLLAGLK